MRATSTRFTVFKDGKSWGEFETHLIGEFNVRNCLAVIIAADAWGISQEKIQEAFDTFKSVKRRMEVRGVERRRDGHRRFCTSSDGGRGNPKGSADEIRRASASSPFSNRVRGRRVSPFFRSRTAKAFSYADYVIIAGVYNTSKASELGKVLDVDELVEDIAMQGKPAMSFPDADAIRAFHTRTSRRRRRRDNVERRLWRDPRKVTGRIEKAVTVLFNFAIRCKLLGTPLPTLNCSNN